MDIATARRPAFGVDKLGTYVMLGGMALGRVISALVSCTVDSWFSGTAGRVLWQYPWPAYCVYG